MIVYALSSTKQSVAGTQVLISPQFHYSIKLKLGTNLNKGIKEGFVVNFGRNFGKIFLVFVKDLLA